MSAIQTPIRLDRFQLGMFLALQDAMGPTEVVWAFNEASYEGTLGGELINLTPVSGPTPGLRRRRRGTLLYPPTSVTIAVGPIVPGQRVSVYCNDIQYPTDVVGGDTAATVRDRLKDVFDADTGATATSSTSGDDLVLTPDFLGGIRQLRLVGPLNVAALPLSDDAVLDITGSSTMLINVEAFSKGRELATGAQVLAAKALAAFQSEDYLNTMRSHGIGIGDMGIVSDLTTIVSGHFETRAGFDVEAALQTAWVRPVDKIEAVQITLNGSDAGGTPVVTETFTVPTF